MKLETAQAQLEQAQQAVSAKDLDLRHAMADVQKSAAKQDHLKYVAPTSLMQLLHLPLEPLEAFDH